jgi:hypothetical protein
MTERYIERSVAAMVTGADRETRRHAASWFEVDFHLADDGPRRTLSQSQHQPLEVGAMTLGDDVDRAVRSVRDPAIEVEATRSLLDEDAEPDALHGASHGRADTVTISRHAAERSRPDAGAPGQVRSSTSRTSPGLA